MKRTALKRGTKPLRRKSKNPKKTARDKAWKEFSLFIRNRDNWTCVTCGVFRERGTAQMQAGHYIHKRANTYWREDNVHAQCSVCNGNQGESELYRAFLIGRYGDGIIEKLETLKSVHKQWTKKEYDELYEKYKGRNQQGFN